MKTSPKSREPKASRRPARPAGKPARPAGRGMINLSEVLRTLRELSSGEHAFPQTAALRRFHD